MKKRSVSDGERILKEEQKELQKVIDEKVDNYYREAEEAGFTREQATFIYGLLVKSGLYLFDVL